ncbi:acyl-CoA dehydrogenase family protein [Nocardia abscessus]|jgi:alkylation response protein AidB-like acyl-CoA dehydrogenase|uniref:acyl-CoA dehydrogenase family protein n=1 Tax=Nocardia TaxID=1817 RepID=UPI0018943E33|nr:acyl-CoA dehydrogenase family protein [Nocardia abscessus]MBF6472458.1 acyl-CoA dehydrogenase family protein [Nocardia abscessus]
MDLKFSPEDIAFREEARTWLEENRPAEPRPNEWPDARDFDVAWQRTQFEAGWAGISWPAEWGGRDLSMLQQLLWYEAYARAHAPGLGVNFVGMSHAGPTLMARGSHVQQAAHIPQILRGEQIWCQGFSEPSSGSDLASLSTRAEIDGDDLVVNGQKIWTSYANVADRQELLVRTNPSAPKHKGITWVICDMSLPGIEIRPIRNIAGQEEFCEVFYNDVRIPLTNVVGGVDNGWSVAMSTLSFERGTAFMADIVELANTLERLVEQAKAAPAPLGKGRAYDDEAVRVQVAELRAEVAALRALNYATVSRIARNGKPGVEGSIVRYYFSQLLQRTQALGVDVLGASTVGPERFSPWARGQLNAFRASIAAGTKDIQRNIIGERMLGLPKDR